MTQNGLEIPGTTVGHQHVSQTITALEYMRFHNQHEPEYKADPESQIKLRSDTRIVSFEKAAGANEPQRITDSSMRKSVGIIAG
jgi:hypothetical protein